MTTTNLILRIEGEVSLEHYAQVVTRFSSLIKEIGASVAGRRDLPWEVVGLTYGSAELVADVLDDAQDVIEQANEVVRAYEQVGYSLSEGIDVPFSPAVGEAARLLRNVIDGGITSMVFATNNRRIEVGAASDEMGVRPHVQWAWGAVRGEIGSVSKRPRNQVTVYDSLFDRAVNCYLQETTLTNIDALWKSARVEVVGKVHYSDKGRPLKITDVVSISPLRSSEAFFQAQGALPWTAEEMPEVVIRRLRDGE